MDGISEVLKSANVEIQTVEGRGRCLFLARQIKKGETIFEEDPLVSCQYAWNKTYQYIACEFCMRPMENVEENIIRLSGNKCFELPFLEYDPTTKQDHRQCELCGEHYCSENCRQKAWKQYHQLLCHENVETEPLMQLVDRWKQIHGPPESFNIMMIAKILACIQMAENQELLYNTYMQFCHQTVNEGQNLTHILLQEKFKCDIDELWPVFSTVMITACPTFGSNPFISTFLTKEGFIRLLSLIGRNGQGIGTSVLAQWAKTVLNLNLPPDVKEKMDNLIGEIYNAVEEHVSSEFMDNEGSALYTIQSCINHSCNPNSKITFPFNNTKLAVIAKQDLLPGEEILISYIDKCTRNRSCHTRRKILRNYYLFTCHCAKCLTDSATEPDESSEEDYDEEME